MDNESQFSPRIGPYEVLAPIGRGAFSRVAKCRHVHTGRIAAVKVAGDGVEDAARLQHEARVLSVLGEFPRAGVVELFETGMHASLPWTAATFVDGPDLTSLYPTRRHGSHESDWTAIARIGRRLAEALGHIHGCGIIHCDLSPRNILLDNGSEPVLIDFDSALVTLDRGAMREVVQPPVTFHGTPGYAAPEQLLGLNVDARSDLYALGCLLYELIVGAPPFRADNPEALCQQHLQLPAAPISSKVPRVPRELDELILRLLQKNPKARLDRAEEVLQRLAHFSAGAQHRTSPAPRRWNLHRSQLIGRDAAVQSLVARVHEAAEGRGGFLLVSGKSGIGKTRLLNELAHRARGFTVLFGRCSAVTGTRERLSAGQALEPFLPFLEWLGSYLQMEGGAVSPELAMALAVLSRYEPSLERHAAASVPPLPPELGRSRVLQSLTEVLRVATARRPLLLIIDDLQWADDLTRAFVGEHHRPFLESSRVLIVAAHRSEDGEPATLGQNVQRVNLSPLSWDELGVMATDMLGTELVPAGLAEALHRHSEGNPFFAAEYLRAFVECGLLRRNGAGDWELADLRRGRSGLSVPTSLQELFALRIQALTDTAKDALEISSLLGRQFPASLIGTVVRETCSAAALDDALEELVRHGILECPSTDQYRFVHDKLREAQAHAIPDARRRDLHRSIALLLASYGKNAEFQMSQAERGLHWAEAGEPMKAVPHLKAAAEQAAARYMNADAVDLYALALSQIEAATEAAAVDQDTWLTQALSVGEARGDVLAWSARHQEACAQQDATLRLVPEWDVLRKARLQRKKAKAYWTLHDYDHATTALEGAETLIGGVNALTTTSQFQEWIEVQQGFFWLHYFARRASDATDRLRQEVAEIVNAHGTATQKSMFYECAACDLLARERYRYSERAAELARRANVEVRGEGEELAQVAEASFSLAFVLVQGPVPQCREAVDILEDNLRMLNPVGEATLLTLSSVYLAVAWRRCGDVERTRAAADRARRSAERMRVVPYVGAALACEAWTLWKSGDAVAAQRLAEDACSWWTKAPHTFPFEWLAKFVLLDVHYMNDDFNAAAQIVSELLDDRQQRFGDDLDASLVHCSSVLRSVAEPRRASFALRAALELARQHSYL